MKLFNKMMLWVLVVCSQSLFSQNRTYVIDPNELKSDQQQITEIKQGQISSIFHGGKNAQVTTFDLTEEVNCIVEFVEDPLFIAKQKNPQALSKAAVYSSRFVQFRSDLASIQQKKSAAFQTSLPAVEMRNEYTRVFFGVAVKVARGLMHEIVQLPYVKKVHLDKQMKADLSESVGIINADDVWTQLGNRGEGVRVGIIDTGIDYFHPALGGGFGAAYKVIGGYDFANKDSDPIDDNGHGTHVAGIVAADGDSIKGVASKAKLWGLKALDASGSGYERDIISAIEMAADPNGDGDYADKLDVVNLSLGGNGNPDDAQSTAIDNGSKLGVVFCIAAGNNSNYRAILSPGTARTAITVGATDKQDKLASFSSKGPNNGIYSIKPEVVAPGVSIKSTWLNSDFINLNGTSMATPHVAGVVALLKSLHKDWTPSKIKSALITTAVDVGYDVMAQGGGRVDAFKAALVSAFAVPSHLSYGIDDIAKTIWTKAETLTVYNNATISQTFLFSEKNPLSGITLNAQPSSLTIAAGDSERIIFTVTVNNSLVPNSEHASLSYSGVVFLSGEKDTMRVPWGFAKAPIIRVKFDTAPIITAFFDQQSGIYLPTYGGGGGTNNEFIMPKGVYDILFYFDSNPAKVVFREQVALQDTISLEVSSSEANHKIDVNPRDWQGNSLSSYGKLNSRLIYILPDTVKMNTYEIFPVKFPVFLSKVSERFSLYVTASNNDFAISKTSHSVDFPLLRGVKTDVTLTNESKDFFSQQVQFDLPPISTNRKVNVIFWIQKLVNGKFSSFTGMSYSPDYQLPLNDWTLTLYQARNKNFNLTVSPGPIGIDTLQGSQLIQSYYFMASPFTIVGDSIAFYPISTNDPSNYFSKNGGKVWLGGPLIHPRSFWSVNGLGSSAPRFLPVIEFRGQMGEIRITDQYRATYSLYRGTTLLDSNIVRNLKEFQLSNEKYTFYLRNPNYFVGNTRGMGTLRSTFDFRQQDPTPSYFTSLRLYNSSGLATNRLAKGEKAILRFSANDYSRSMIDSTKIFYREHGTETWSKAQILSVWDNPYPPPYVGPLYTTDLSNATNFDSAAVDLKILIRDYNENLTEWTLEPAFAVGKYLGGLLVGVVEDEFSKTIPKEFALRQNYPNPFNLQTLISFDVPRTSNVSLKIFNLLGQEVRTILQKELNAGSYKAEWDGKDNAGRVVSSGVYLYQMSSSGFAKTQKMILLK